MRLKEWSKKVNKMVWVFIQDYMSLCILSIEEVPQNLYCISSATEIIIMEVPNFCGTCLQWDFHYKMFLGTCFRVYFLQHFISGYFLRNFLYSN